MKDRVTLLLFLAWMPLGVFLAGILALAWLQTSRLKTFLADAQGWYAITASPVPWWLRSDSHLHFLCAGAACLWIALGLRLFSRIQPMLAIPLTVLVALSDEMAQLFSGERDFEWSDQYADATGILISGLLIWSFIRKSRF